MTLQHRPRREIPVMSKGTPHLPRNRRQGSRGDAVAFQPCIILAIATF